MRHRHVVVAHVMKLSRASLKLSRASLKLSRASLKLSRASLKLSRASLKLSRASPKWLPVRVRYGEPVRRRNGEPVRLPVRGRNGEPVRRLERVGTATDTGSERRLERRGFTVRPGAGPVRSGPCNWCWLGRAVRCPPSSLSAGRCPVRCPPRTCPPAVVRSGVRPRTCPPYGAVRTGTSYGPRSVRRTASGVA